MEGMGPRSWQDIPGAPTSGTVLAQFDAIPEGGATLLSLGDAAAPYRIILLRSSEQVLAYVNRCAHFGVPLAEKVEHLGLKPNESIRCSVHYARYRWQDGYCEWGDCEGESLLSIPVIVSRGQVLVS
jgi:nitrite reductase/ring-hydroxylating ferredoxin subunit